MPISKISDAPASIKKLDDIDLTLAQINQILEWYDAYKPAEDRGDIDSAMAIAIARFKREYTVEDGKWKKKEQTSSLAVDLEIAALILEEKTEREKLREARKTMAETSLDEQAQQVRRAFDEQFRSPSSLPTTDWLWVTEVFEDHVIVEAGEHLYSVPYSEQDGEVVFSGRDEWTEVERTYSPLSAMWQGIKSLYEQAQRMFTQSQRGKLSSAGRLYILLDTEKRKLLVDEDGLIWKDLLVPGDWFRPDGELVQVSKQDIDDVVLAFVGGTLPPVPIPFGHVEHLSGDDPANNNGFVRALRVGSAESPFEETNGDYVLWGGLEITEPDTREKIERGSISNVSVWLEPDFHDLKDEDRVWPLVLWHVALTDKPQLTPELKNFVAFTATRDNRGGMIMSEETQVPGNGQEASPSEEPTALEALQGQVTQLIERVEQLEGENKELKVQVQQDAHVIGQQQEDLHSREVEAIVAALQGLGTHRMVRLTAHQMVPPAVVSQVQPILMADRPNGDGRSALTLSVKVGDGGEEKQVSATQMVLDVINAVAEAGLLPDNLNRGKRAAAVPPAEPKTPEQEKADKDAEVEAYLAKHPEVKTGRTGR